jgi:hypothetical protein
MFIGKWEFAKSKRSFVYFEGIENTFNINTLSLIVQHNQYVMVLIGVEKHYGDPFWGVTWYYFLGLCMYLTSNFWKIFTIFCILC